MMAGIAMGTGIIISALTTKYRDFQFLVAFGVQLGMYATPVIYPLSYLDEDAQWIALANPLTAGVGASFVPSKPLDVETAGSVMSVTVVY